MAAIQLIANDLVPAVFHRAVRSGKAKDKGVSKVCFDRGGYMYHGRVKAFADAARENGLDF